MATAMLFCLAFGQARAQKLIWDAPSDIPLYQVQKRDTTGWRLDYTIAADSVKPLGNGLWAAKYEDLWAVTHRGRYLTQAIYQDLRRANGSAVLGTTTTGFLKLLSLTTGLPISLDSFTQVQVDGNWAIGTVANEALPVGRKPRPHLYHLGKGKRVYDRVRNYKEKFVAGQNLVIASSAFNNPCLLTVTGDTLISPDLGALDIQVADVENATGEARIAIKLSVDGKVGWQLYRYNGLGLEAMSQDFFQTLTLLPNGNALISKGEHQWLTDAELHPMAGGPCDSLSVRPDGLVVHKTDSAVWHYYPNGCRLSDPDLGIGFRQDTMVVARNGSLWQFYGSQGLPISFGIGLHNTTFTAIGRFSEGLSPTRLHEKMGFTGPEGLKRLGHRYDTTTFFTEGRAVVKLPLPSAKEGSGWGVVTKRDSLVVQPFYDSAAHYCQSMCLVRKDGKYSILDIWGKPIASGLDAALRQPTGSLLLQKHALYGFLNTKGEQTLLPLYLKVCPQPGDEVLYQSRSGRWGFWSPDKRFILETMFGQVVPNDHDGSVAVLK